MIWFWLDTGWGCGGVGVDASGIVRDSCPIFRKLRGQQFSGVVSRGRYKYEVLRRREAEEGEAQGS